ncbi:MAG TPA: helix-turn-helix domain-containing protein [Promineifilum sp.]|nr:helix-turn-helix domain-containing protein [Promineifilum sp.]
MKLLTLTETSQHLGIKRRTFYNMLKDGRFPVKPVPNSKPRRWRQEDVDAWRLDGNGANALRPE